MRAWPWPDERQATQSQAWNGWSARAPVCVYGGGVARPRLSQTARPDAGAMEEYAREPWYGDGHRPRDCCCGATAGCGSPWRIVDDCGGAFTMGVIGGGVFQAIKGFRNAPVAWLQDLWFGKNCKYGPVSFAPTTQLGLLCGNTVLSKRSQILNVCAKPERFSPEADYLDTGK
ncbi:mitochondrial import inner membrane translocase subunit Tim17-B isoform X3 [Callorhinus ursinus]|uniref:mitochondrial import inner membrane translocase subunit Tim17-B isoform X3 n=1 Tax=Callorhinus ursinus TaxID=34884 RepID=UPI003CD03982